MTRLFLNTFIPTITSPVSIVPAEAPVKSYGFNLVLYATVLSESDCPATINLSENIVHLLGLTGVDLSNVSK